jgi:hypothetical protein
MPGRRGSNLSAELHPLSDPCPSGALYCDDFEGNNAASVAVVTSGNDAVVQMTEAPSGSSALRATVTAGPSTAYLRTLLPAALSGGSVFLTGWVRVPQEQAHNVAPLALWSPDEEDFALRLVLQDGRVDAWSKAAPMTSSYQLNRGDWYCLGLEVRLGDAPNGKVIVTVNDEEVASVGSVDTLPNGGFQAVAVGALWSNSSAELWVDRVIVSLEQVPCF